MNLEPVMTYQQIADEFGVCQTQAMKWVNSAIESAKCEFEKRGVPADSDIAGIAAAEGL